MWIVSKDKDVIVNTDKIISFYNTDNYEICAMYSSDYGEDSGSWMVGTYTNKSRSDEVFNDLIEFLTGRYSDPYDKFEMPEE